ncbi:MAG: PIN domain-containing protein [Erysipelotrichaceae bacterium]|nr:PIN domain-containing protein [Erysipelotrichaceae bacterium]
MIIMFDTCVILDYLLDRAPYADDAEKLLMEVADDNITGLLSVKSLMDIHYFLEHATHDEHEVRRILNALLDVLILVDSASDDALMALSSEMNDYEDALMVQTALKNGAEYIATRNLRDYKHSDIQALLPAEMLNMLKIV